MMPISKAAMLICCLLLCLALAEGRYRRHYCRRLNYHICRRYCSRRPPCESSSTTTTTTLPTTTTSLSTTSTTTTGGIACGTTVTASCLIANCPEEDLLPQFTCNTPFTCCRLTADLQLAVDTAVQLMEQMTGQSGTDINGIPDRVSNFTGVIYRPVFYLYRRQTATALPPT